MLTAGDEMGRTQGGNNNAYCQDNEISWVDWALEPWQADLLDFDPRCCSRCAATTRCCASGTSSRAARPPTGGAKDLAGSRRTGTR